MINEMLIVLGIILGLVLTGVLNRLRGTGLIKHFGTLKIQEHKFNIFKKEYIVPEMAIKVNLVWNHVFALYYGAIFGLVSGIWYVGLAIFVAYLIGEAKGWGEWIGTLTRIEPKDEKFIAGVYKDDEGKTFPFIHQISNFFIKEQIDNTLEEKIKQYTKYATLALVLRGIWWFLFITIISIAFDLVSWKIGIIGLVLVGINFPIACWLGKHIKFTKTFGFLHFSRGWENQEFIFGCIQFVCIILPIFYSI